MRNEKETQQKTKEFYNKYNYPDGNDGRYKYWIEKISKYLNLNELKGKDVLDVGCGTGTISNIFDKFGGNVYAFDQSNSIEYVKRDYPNINVRNGDALNNPFNDNEFDLVASIGVLHHTPNCYKGFQECARVTKPGGHMLILLYRKWHWYPILYHTYKFLFGWSSIEQFPKFILKGLRLFANWYYKEETSMEDIKRLMADQYYTPQATFHSKGQIKRWCKRNNCILLKYGSQYFWQHGVYYIKKCFENKYNLENRRRNQNDKTN